MMTMNSVSARLTHPSPCAGSFDRRNLSYEVRAKTLLSTDIGYIMKALGNSLQNGCAGG